MEIKMEKLLRKDLMRENGEIDFDEESKKLIHDIAVECRESKAYKDFADDVAKYREQNLSAEQIYADMIYKIANAPTALHVIFTVRFLVPLIDERLGNADRGGIGSAGAR